MIIGVPKEIKLQEHRIGLTPDSVKVLNKKGHKVLIQSNGGLEAGFTNQDYEKSGAVIYDNAKKPTGAVRNDLRGNFLSFNGSKYLHEVAPFKGEAV